MITRNSNERSSRAVTKMQIRFISTYTQVYSLCVSPFACSPIANIANIATPILLLHSKWCRLACDYSRTHSTRMVKVIVIRIKPASFHSLYILVSTHDLTHELHSKWCRLACDYSTTHVSRMVKVLVIRIKPTLFQTWFHPYVLYMSGSLGVVSLPICIASIDNMAKLRPALSRRTDFRSKSTPYDIE
jgi:hypothetical protein